MKKINALNMTVPLFILADLMYLFSPGITLAFLPKLPGIDYILPDDIGTGCQTGHGIQVHLRYPDNENGILLPKSLPAADAFTIAGTDALAQIELQGAGGKSHKGGKDFGHSLVIILHQRI